MSNKDLLKLENDLRDDLPKYKEKPKIEHIQKPHLLTSKVSNFLAKIDKTNNEEQTNNDRLKMGSKEACVEMDIYMTPSSD